jgi:hypothetical protein
MAPDLEAHGDAADERLLALMTAIAAGDDRSLRLLAQEPALAVARIARRTGGYFIEGIQHHVYAGDTALHVAAAAHRPDLATALLGRGVDVRARNRRGAEPLHYAADGSPGAPWWHPGRQRDVVVELIAGGADPEAVDADGVAALHRAVRTRSASAARALLEHGADVHRRNGTGSTPLHLAVQTTGRTGSGSPAARDEQARVIAVLLEYGARPDDVDGRGRSVIDAASSDWIRALLAGAGSRPPA